MTTEKPGTGPGDTERSGGGARNRDIAGENTRPCPGTRAGDLRFILPAPPRTALVVGMPDVAAALERSGVEVAGSDEGVGRARDLVVVPRALIGSVIESGASSILVDAAIGRSDTRSLEAAGYHVTRLLVRHGRAGPRLVVPTHGAPLAFALLRWARPPGRLRRLRNAAISTLAGHGVRLARTMATLATTTPSPPWPIASASHLGIPARAEWLFIPGEGDELQRAVFHVFRRGAAAPEWVLKLSRVAGNDSPFCADELGLRLASEAGPEIARRVPVLLGRLDLGGLPASVETAAPGRPLNEHLAASGHARSKRASIDAVAEWVLDLGASTAGDVRYLADERARLASLSETASVAVRAIPPVPAVLAHNDLGTWNVVVSEDGRSFTVLDWEAARRPAMPLWDLMYFLADAVVALDGPARPEMQVKAALSLFRGEHRASPLLFEWTRRYVERLTLPNQSVGALAALCWEHHASSHRARAAALSASAGEEPAPLPADLSFLARLSTPWASDPALGIAWSTWSA